MEIVLKKQWAGHCVGTRHSVGDDRAEHLMTNGIAVPDQKFLLARAAVLEKLAKSAPAEEAKRGPGRPKKEEKSDA